jgi:hypothetical protein
VLVCIALRKALLSNCTMDVQKLRQPRSAAAHQSSNDMSLVPSSGVVLQHHSAVKFSCHIMTAGRHINLQQHWDKGNSESKKTLSKKAVFQTVEQHGWLQWVWGRDSEHLSPSPQVSEDREQTEHTTMSINASLYAQDNRPAGDDGALILPSSSHVC